MDEGKNAEMARGSSLFARMQYEFCGKMHKRLAAKLPPKALAADAMDDVQKCAQKYIIHSIPRAIKALDFERGEANIQLWPLSIRFVWPITRSNSDEIVLFAIGYAFVQLKWGGVVYGKSETCECATQKSHHVNGSWCTCWRFAHQKTIKCHRSACWKCYCSITIWIRM